MSASSGERTAEHDHDEPSSDDNDYDDDEDEESQRSVQHHAARERHRSVMDAVSVARGSDSAATGMRIFDSLVEHYSPSELRAVADLLSVHLSQHATPPQADRNVMCLSDG